MRAGEFPNGTRVLRAKIDMASPNMNLRDPVLYRILHAEHPRTGNTWCIYPTYDYAHGQSDAIEGITHSLCTLEFEDHRPLYDWLIDNLPVPSRPHQYEFAPPQHRLYRDVKRILTRLVSDGRVTGWDDPRMPTLAGVRRRGIPAAALRDFVRRGGIAKSNSVAEFSAFEYSIRELLNRIAPRRMAVLRPLKLVIENWAEGKTETLEAINDPEDPSAGVRPITLVASSTSNGTTSWRSRRRSSSVCRLAARCGCVTATSSPADPRSRTSPARWWNCAAPMIPRRAAAMHRLMDARCRRRCTGWRRRTRSPPRCVCSTTCSRDPIRARTATSWPTSIRTRSRCCATACWSLRLPQRRSARRSSSNGSATSGGSRLGAGQAGVQSHGRTAPTPGRRCRAK